jgi:hypothetical protein
MQGQVVQVGVTAKNIKFISFIEFSNHITDALHGTASPESWCEPWDGDKDFQKML